MAQKLRRATLLAPLMLVAGFLAVSCFDDTAGPRVFQGQFSLAPQFESSVAQIITIDRFRVLLVRTSDSTIALDTVIAIVPGTDSVDLSLSVPMLTASETFWLTLSLITPAGDTAFQAGPTSVTPTSTGGAPPAIPVTVAYVGVGANAASVRIVTDSAVVFFGDTVALVAEALDSTGAVIPGTPIAWGSLDTLKARVPNATQGKVVGAAQRGAARITATLITGPADTTGVQVQPVPVRAAVELGNNQSAQVATLLAQPVRFRVKAADSLGVAGLKVRFSVVAGGGVVTPDSAVTNDSGRVDVQWKLGPASGAQSIRARIAAAFPDSVVTAAATALAGPPDSLGINDGDGQTIAAGLALPTAPSVVVLDSLNNPVPGVAVTFAVTAGGGSLTGATPTTDATGVARVGSWTLGTLAGANALRAFVARGPGDTLNVTFGATATPAAAASLTLSGIPGSLTAGAAATVSVTAKDAYGNQVTGYQGTVHFTSSDGAALLPADYAFVTADSGAHTFSGGVTLVTSGSRSVTATDIVTSSITGSQTVTVQPGTASAAASVITVSGTTVLSGGVVTLTLQAKDSLGNNLTSGGATVVFSASGGTSAGTIGATTDNGDGTYSATFTAVTAGTATTIGATLNGVAVSTTLPTITVAAGLVSTAMSTVSVSSGSVLSGSGVTLTLQAKDAVGNNLTAGGLAVVFSSSGGTSTGVISGTNDVGDGTYTATFTGVIAGTATTIGATIGGAAVTSTLPTVTVGVGPISETQSTVAVSNGTVISGSSVTLTLQGKDAAGNLLTSGGAPVVFTQSGGTSTGTISVATNNGDGTYTATFLGVTAGTPTTIGATINSIAVTTTLPTITVTPGLISATTSVVTVSSATVTSGATVLLKLQAKDAALNNLTSGGATVVFTATTGAGISTGTIGATIDSTTGVYTATFTGVTAGTPTTIGATVNTTAVTTTLPTLQVTPGAAASLIFASEPTNTTVNSAISAFQVTALDAASNTATGFSGPVALAFQNNPAGGSLGGTVTVSAASGVATFSTVSVTTVGSAYALQASATGVTSATSQQFLITPVGMTHLWTGAASTVWTDPGNWQGGSAPSLTTDNVFVPASAATQPAISSPALTVGAVVVETGATLTIASGDTLSVFGDLLAGFTSVTGPGAVRLLGGGTLAGSVPGLLLAGRYTAIDSVKVSGDLIVRGPGDTLNLGGNRLQVLGAFTTDSGATLTMINAADTLDVAGAITFAGHDDSLLTAGVILARGDFTQIGYTHPDAGCGVVGDSVDTFKARGAHRVVLAGTALQTVTFETPGPSLGGGLISECPTYAGGSQFANLEIDNPAGVTFASPILAVGSLTVTNGNVDATFQRISVAGDVSAPAANLTADLLEVGATLSFGTGTYSVATSTFLGSVAAVPSALPYQSLNLVGSGATTWTGALNLTGSLVLGGTAQLQLGASSTVGGNVTVEGTGLLNLGGHTLTIPSSFGFFQTSGNGAFQMTAPLDSLIIGGFAYFWGGSTDGLLAAGTILVGSNVYQYGATDARSFRSTGTKVVLNGVTAAQGVYFAQPGDLLGSGTYVFGDSRFDVLEVPNPYGFILGSDVYVNGAVTTPGSGPITDAGTHTLRATDITTPSLTAAQVDVAGTLSVSGSYTVANTIFSGTGQSIPLYPYQNLTVNGIAAITRPPTISGNLTVGPAGQLDIGANTLTIPGNVDAGNSIIGTGTIEMTGVGTTLSGALPNLVVSGTVSLAGSTAVTDSVKVSAATLTVNGQRLTVGGDLILDGPSNAPGALSFNSGGAAGQVQVSGTLVADRQYYSLVMKHPTDSLIAFGGFVAVNGPALAPYDTLTAGLMYIGNTFNAYEFFPDSRGTHKVVLAGNDAAVAPYFYLNDGWFRDLEVTTLASATDATWPLQSTFSTDTLVYGDLAVSQGGILDVGGFTVLGNLTTTDNGRVRSTSFSPTLRVHGDATFGGGSTGGLLTTGTLELYGNFSQTTSAQAFAADSGFTTSFVGTAPQSISFANPDTSASHFGAFRVAQPNAPGVSMNSPVIAVGALMVPGDTLSQRQTITGNGNGLTVGGLNVSRLTLERALLVWTDSGVFSDSNFTRADSITFGTSYLPSDVQFYVYHRQDAISTPPPFNMNSFVWKVQADAANGGRYIKAERYGSAIYALYLSLGLLQTGNINLPVPDISACSTLVAPAIEGVGGSTVSNIYYICS